MLTLFDVYTRDLNYNRIVHMTFHVEWAYDSAHCKYTPDLYFWEEWLPDGTYIDDSMWKYYRPGRFYADLDSLTANKDWYSGYSSCDIEFDPEEQVLALAKQWYKEKHSVIQYLLHSFKR